MAEGKVPTPPPGPARMVFISYASADKGVADAVCQALERAGVSCWIAPRDVTPGEFYAESIVHAIDSARAVVLVLSAHGADSQHVLREVERASSKRHPVLSFRIDAAPLPAGLEYFLNSSQWLDAQSTGVDRALPRLIEAVRTVLSQSPAPEHAGAAPAASSTASPRSRRLPVVAVAVVASLALAYFLAARFRSANHPAAPTPTAATAVSDKSIAVLPFVDMSEKHDQEYFSDGLSEELIDHLAHDADLKVIARTSSFAFKGKNEDMRSIAAKLGVAHLLEGSVRKSGGEIRITAQLIRAVDGVHLWSETYDRQLTDIFKVQDEISTTVAKALNAALNPASASGARRGAQGAVNVAAYNALLQGNYFFWRGDKGDNSKAVERLLQALRLDPRYSAAWSKLARVYAWQGFAGELTGAEGAREGRAAAERALALDPDCAEAYYARANIERLIEGDWAASLADNEKAAVLDPHGEVGVNARANILNFRAHTSGRFDEAIAFARQRLQTDPLDTETMSDLAYFELVSGRLDESVAASRRLLDQNADYVGANAQYAEALLLMGNSSAALAAAQKESGDVGKLQALACVYWTMGRRADSDAALATLERGFADRKAYEIASIHAWRGEADAAFSWLDRAYLQSKGSVGTLKVDPMFQKVRTDPRYVAMLRKAKLSE